MQTIKYRTDQHHNRISKKEVVRETPHSVTMLNGKLEHKRSSYQNWHDSFAGAKQFLLERATKDVENISGELGVAKEVLATVKNLRALDRPKAQ